MIIVLYYMLRSIANILNKWTFNAPIQKSSFPSIKIDGQINDFYFVPIRKQVKIKIPLFLYFSFFKRNFSYYEK